MIASHIRFAYLIGAFSVAIPLLAAVPAAGKEVVQQMPDQAAAELTRALQRLSRNPDSVPALVAAGRASLDLDDLDAARGFFERAQAVDPDDGRMLSGLALVAVRSGQPAAAVQLFDNAEARGQNLTSLAGDRGLAYDLIGQNQQAQKLYRLALAREASDEVTRRLAVSLAISGNAALSETTLLPLLQRQDRAAYRARAFALAILGRDEESVAIAEAMLPARLAQRLAPYLRNMSELTPSQQAAAAITGVFPSAAQMGRDAQQIAAVSQPASAAPAPRPVSSDARLAPAGPPLGNQPQSAAASPPVVIPRAVVGEPIAAPPPAPVQKPQPDLEEAFADFSLPAGSEASRPASWAVDITSITPKREQPAPPPVAKPAAPAHPARHWVQVATGQDMDAFRFDWLRIVRKSAGLLDERKAYTAAWGQTNRLITGPFASAREAQDFVSALAGAGIESFRFSSDEGEEVKPLG